MKCDRVERKGIEVKLVRKEIMVKLEPKEIKVMLHQQECMELVHVDLQAPKVIKVHKVRNSALSSTMYQRVGRIL